MVIVTKGKLSILLLQRRFIRITKLAHFLIEEIAEKTIVQTAWYSTPAAQKTKS